MPPSIESRTRGLSDPVRNFKFQVSMFHPNNLFTDEINKLGFMSVEGIAMNTEMVPYREGGWNTNPHKLPGQTDFAPLTMAAGVFYDRPGIWLLAQAMFSVQQGSGTIALGKDFRYDMGIRVLDHPVTMGNASGTEGSPEGAVIGFKFYNCWTASVGFNGLNALGNEVLIQQMTVHHEGFDTFFGNDRAPNLANPTRLGSFFTPNLS